MELNSNNTRDTDLNQKDNSEFFIKNKAKNLVTALFMVTDIMDKEEPMKNKFRSLGLELTSETHLSLYKTNILSHSLLNKLSLILSLLDIATDLKMISIMNGNILKKEFSSFKNILEKNINNLYSTEERNLEAIFKKEEMMIEEPNLSRKSFQTGKKLFEIYEPIRHNGQNKTGGNSIRQPIANIGLQKGSTLLNALKEIENSGAIKKTSQPKSPHNLNKNTLLKNNDNNIVKKDKTDRQAEILAIIKTNPNGLTITDIKKQMTGELSLMSEKTLQRELAKMFSVGVLNKVGDKRWSRYFSQK